MPNTPTNIIPSFVTLCWLLTSCGMHTKKILLNQTKIRLYLPFSDCFGTKRTSVWFQINRKMVNTIWFLGDLIKFRKHFSVCGPLQRSVSSGPVDIKRVATAVTTKILDCIIDTKIAHWFIITIRVIRHN